MPFGSKFLEKPEHVEFNCTGFRPCAVRTASSLTLGPEPHKTMMSCGPTLKLLFNITLQMLQEYDEIATFFFSQRRNMNESPSVHLKTDLNRSPL